MPQDTAGRYEALQWVMFQMGGIGPMFGQLGFFHKFAGKDYEDKRPRDRYVAESKRLLGVLDKHLQGRKWILGSDYSIADIATFPWIRNLVGFYERATWWASRTSRTWRACSRPSWRAPRTREHSEAGLSPPAPAVQPVAQLLADRSISMRDRR
jgi:glutathione S-transferase